MIMALGEFSPQFDEEESFIAPNAVLIGKVVLKKGSSIWFSSVLRGDDDEIEVGERSNIQDGCICHVDPGYPVRIGKDVTIGHNAIIHGCTIGSSTLIGMGSTILNGAQIGNNCLIGANALITEGKVIPDNSVVLGAPGKVVRELDAAGIEQLRKSAELYVRRSQRYRAMLRQL